MQMHRSENVRNDASGPVRLIAKSPRIRSASHLAQHGAEQATSPVQQPLARHSSVHRQSGHTQTDAEQQSQPGAQPAQHDAPRAVADDAHTEPPANATADNSNTVRAQVNMIETPVGK
jgi:hypothetical protein